jgi:hypothetical protein
MYHKEKNASLTGAIVNQLNEWLPKNKENQIPKEILTGLDNWSKERLVFSMLQSLQMFISIYNKVILVKENLYLSKYGKNSYARRDGILLAYKFTNELIEENKLESYADIFRAKMNGENIHAFPHKHHKLEITHDDYYEFGQLIVEQESKKVGQND